MTENWSLYHPEIPEFLRRLAETPPMARLRQVGMNCGCEYTSFPSFAGVKICMALPSSAPQPLKLM